MAFFPGIGVAAIMLLLRDRRLARIGWVAEGKVTGCARRGSRFSVYYEFHTDAGLLIEGSNNYSDEYDMDSQIRVIYLRHHPARNAPYPLASYHTV